MNACPELETLLVGVAEHDAEALAHLKTCPDCAFFAEQHRQLEKDLFRLADPMPPVDFVQSVMARVALEPAPTRVELRTGLSILAVTLMGAVLAFVAAHAQVPSPNPFWITKSSLSTSHKIGSIRKTAMRRPSSPAVAIGFIPFIRAVVVLRCLGGTASCPWSSACPSTSSGSCFGFF